MGKHTTTWEDEMVAGMQCDGKDADIISVDEKPSRCSVCGKLVKLVWHVYIEDVEEDG